MAAASSSSPSPYNIVLHHNEPIERGYIRYGEYKVFIEEHKIVTFGTFSELLGARWNAIVDATRGVDKCKDDIVPYLQILARLAHMRVRAEYFEEKHNREVYLDDYCHDCSYQIRVKTLCRRLLSGEDGSRGVDGGGRWVENLEGSALDAYFNDIIHEQFYNHLEVCIRLWLGKIIIDVVELMRRARDERERDCAMIRYAESLDAKEDDWSAILIKPFHRIPYMTNAQIDQMINIDRLTRGLEWNWNNERIARNMYLYYRENHSNMPAEKMIQRLCLYFSMFDDIIIVLNRDVVNHPEVENDEKFFRDIIDDIENVAQP